jgi:hypothetical protein
MKSHRLAPSNANTAPVPMATVQPSSASHVEHGTDVRMAERGERLGFPLEPLLQIGIAGDVRGEDFDRDGAIETCVSGPVDFTHPAGTERGQDLVRAEASTCSESHVG